MIVLPGGSYLVTLQLQNAERLGYQWLVGAISARYPLSDVVSIEQYDGAWAEVILRWRKQRGEINAGDQILPVMEGIMLPFSAMPRGTVTGVSQVGDPVVDVETEISSPARMLMAGGILLATWYLVDRIKRKQ